MEDANLVLFCTKDGGEVIRHDGMLVVNLLGTSCTGCERKLQQGFLLSEIQMRKLWRL